MHVDAGTHAQCNHHTSLVPRPPSNVDGESGDETTITHAYICMYVHTSKYTRMPTHTHTHTHTLYTPFQQERVLLVTGLDLVAQAVSFLWNRKDMVCKTRDSHGQREAELRQCTLQVWSLSSYNDYCSSEMLHGHNCL